MHRKALVSGYYADNPEKYRERCRQWRRENVDHRRAYAAEYGPAYYRGNAEVIKARVAAWKLENPDRTYEAARRRRALIRGVETLRLDPTEIEARMSMFAFRCWMCGGAYDHIDHVKPVSKGGAHMLSNMRPACSDCNLRKHNKWPFTIADVTWLSDVIAA